VATMGVAALSEVSFAAYRAFDDEP
jgi:hypothetical protein